MNLMFGTKKRLQGLERKIDDALMALERFSDEQTFVLSLGDNKFFTACAFNIPKDKKKLILEGHYQNFMNCTFGSEEPKEDK